MDASNSAPQVQLPAYRSHKTVFALRISAMEQTPPGTPVEGGSWLLHFADPGYAAIAVTPDWIATRRPLEGGYYVVYADGYSSFSPAAAFESGNTPVARWGLLRSQEEKYDVNEFGRMMNRGSGIAIPDEEPLIVFRGKDPLAIAALEAYAIECEKHGQLMHAGRIREKQSAFNAYRAGYPERVKLPD